MKKKSVGEVCPFLNDFNKIILIMKFSLFLLLFTVYTFGNSFSQDNTAIDLDVKNKPIKDILKIVEDQSGFRFFYNDRLTNLNNLTSIKAKKSPLNNVLTDLLKNQKLSYSIMDNKMIVILPTEIYQDFVVTGKVTDASTNEPLPGVNITIEGTTTGTITDLNGNYSISVPDPRSKLVFSYVGYNNEVIGINERSNIDVTLVMDIRSLEEVVVVGYGSIKKSDLTGSVGSVESDVIASTTITDATGALQGRVAGVNIEKNVGRPGSGFDVTIRGLSSINNSNGPLYVIDGIPTNSGLNDLNPEDIEKIDILKDASATAIYGSRGANGVVIVTTKKGKAGKFSIQYNGYYGLRTPSHLPDMMDGEEYVQWRTDLYTNLGMSTDRTNADFFTSDEWARIDNGEYTDWIDLILRNGTQTSNTLTASGGDANGTFALSIGQLKEEGTVPGQDYKRYNLRLNIDRTFSEKWQAGGNLYFIHSIQNKGSYETLRSAFRLSPVASPYDEDDEPQFFAFRNDGVTNPLFEYSDDGETREGRRYRAFGNIFLKFEPLKGISITSGFSPQMIYKRDGNAWGQFCKESGGKVANTKADYYTNDYWGYVWDNQLNYIRNTGQHSINFIAVQSIQYEQWEESYQKAKNFPFNSKWYNLDAVNSDDIVASQTDYEQRSLASFLGRLQYTYNNKYLFTISGRYDGSSRLAEGNKWAFFPSAAFAWRMTEENFLKDFDRLSNLKLRLSYGLSGNDAVSIYGTQSNVTQKNYDFNGTSSTAYYKNGLANYNLTWEKTAEINVGVDYGFFKHRINGAIDVYRRDSKDIIMKRQLPETSGWGSIWDNIGWVRNYGVELGLNTINIQTNNFSWNTSIIFDMNKNEIIELYGDKKDDIGNKLFIGEPIQSNYDYQFDGIWQLDEADRAAVYGQTPGQIKVKDLNDDDVIDSDDKKIIGQRTPKWSGSITNTLKYKNFDFSFYVYTRQGQQLYSTFKSTFMSLEGNYKNVAVDYWSEDNPTNKYPQPGNKGKYFNSFRYGDISFVRVGNISFGYSLPGNTLDKLKIEKLRFYFTMTNPFTFTSYEGFDPEWGAQNTWGEATGYSTYLIGINLEL